MARKIEHGAPQQSIKKDFFARLAEKDQLIADLRAQLSARISHTSTLENRLLSALDALDATQATSEAELCQERLVANQLRQKLAAYGSILRAAEDDKEDSRSAVLKLVEKVETSNDYSKWPHSRLHVSGPLELVPLATAPPSSPSREYEHDAHLYASAVIEELTRKLAQEKKAHALLKADAESHFVSLEAQLARREAELEHWIMHNPSPLITESLGGRPSFISTKHNSITNPERPQPALLSQDEAISILETAASRNRRLDAENKILAEKLDRAKKAAARANDLPGYIYNSTGGSNAPHPRRLNKSVQTNGYTSSAPKAIASSSAVCSPPQRFPLPSRKHLRYGKAEQLTAPISDRMPSPLKVLGRQIAELGQELGELTNEKNVLEKVLNGNGYHSSPSGGNEDGDVKASDFTGILLIEEECIHLMKSVSALRKELENMRVSARSREEELCVEIGRLEAALQQCQCRGNQGRSNSGDDNHQQEMLHPSADHIPPFEPDRQLEPSLVPLPSSPTPIPLELCHAPQSNAAMLESPIDFAHWQPLSPRRRSPRDVAVIEQELEDARRDANKKELAIQELKADIDNLKQRHKNEYRPGQERTESDLK